MSDEGGNRKLGGTGIDLVTGSGQVISQEHHEIHEGDHFFICGFETEASDGTIKFTVQTPDTIKWAHMLFEVEGTSQTEIRIYEDAVATGGTPAVAINNNRNSLNTSDLTIIKDPTVSDAGDLLFAQSKGLVGVVPSATPKEGLDKREKEIILKQNTKYLFEITSKDDDNIISYCGEWYEHTSRTT